MPQTTLARIAGRCAYVSGVLSIFGIVFLFVFFAVGEPWGTLNDIVIVPQYLLALPIAVALHQLLRSRAPLLSLVAILVGIIGILAVTVLQLLLISRVLTFAQQGLPVSLAIFLGVGGWILIVGYLGRTTGTLRHSLLLAVLGWSGFGYPIWAFGLGRQLLAASRN